MYCEWIWDGVRWIKLQDCASGGTHCDAPEIGGSYIGELTYTLCVPD